MTQPKPIPIVLAQLAHPPHPVVFPSGETYRVRTLDGHAAQLHQAARRSDDPVVLWDLAAHLIPDAPRHEIETLDADMVAAVFAIAGRSADAVIAEMERRAEETRRRAGGEGGEGGEGNAVAPGDGSGNANPSPAPA